ncbi:NAD(P)-binding protein [Mycena kentingensis (nom. inval.)]|nr:NAD(P)-binding protein [Mycena kentingensis (nom. inval.)]
MPAPAPALPRQTDAPPQPRASTSRIRRQIVADQDAVAAAKETCQVFSGNERISCFPDESVSIPQHQWATFVWNSNNPDFTQTNRVDIYLYHGDSLEQILAIKNHVNPKNQAGSVTRQVNDTWFGDRGANWAGTNISYPFYWIIARAGEDLDDGTLKPQTTFSAVQTTYADSIVSSMASASRSASLASASAAAATLTASNGALTTAVSPAGGIQRNSSSSSFPRYAIAIIVVGIVAVGVIVFAMLFAIYRLRKREREEEYRQRGVPTRVRSRSPSMSHVGGGGLVAPIPVPSAMTRDASVLSHQQSGAMPVMHSGPQRTTSPTQRTISPDSTASGSGVQAKPFSTADAAIMASAFRAELRAPGGSFRDIVDGDGDGDADDDVDDLRRSTSVTTASRRGWRASSSSGGTHSYQAVRGDAGGLGRGGVGGM